MPLLFEYNLLLWFQALNDVRAPKHYLDWIREQNERIIDKLPVVSHFKRAKITRFLLNDADQNLIDDLLDVSIHMKCVSEQPKKDVCIQIYLIKCCLKESQKFQLLLQVNLLLLFM